MELPTSKEPRRRKSAVSIHRREPAVSAKEQAQSQPVSPRDDVRGRVAARAYELYAERGYRQGYALEDWLEAEREILGHECNA
jgi:hypothetical protein